MSYGLLLKKESFKFSSSHFTIFGAGRAEALHGHNYQVGVRLAFSEVDPELEMKSDFKPLKESIKKICDQWDEKILIPLDSPFLKIKDSAHYQKHTEVQYEERHYCFPTNEVELLPLANITSEGLARLFCEKLAYAISGFDKITVLIKETSGQSATYTKVSRQ